MSVLVHAEIDGQRLDDESLLMESLLILIGGDETARYVISGGMHQLMLHPDQKQKLVEAPGAIPRAVEEMLRWTTNPHVAFGAAGTTSAWAVRWRGSNSA